MTSGATTVTDELPHPEIFAQHVRVGLRGGCWLWTGSLSDDGYGCTGARYTGTTLRANRVAYELYVGPIPPGKQVLHSCDNRKCVSPEHLFLGTLQDNMDDMWAKGRARPRGKSNPKRIYRRKKLS